MYAFICEFGEDCFKILILWEIALSVSIGALLLGYADIHLEILYFILQLSAWLITLSLVRVVIVLTYRAIRFRIYRRRW